MAEGSLTLSPSDKRTYQARVRAPDPDWMGKRRRRDSGLMTSHSVVLSVSVSLWKLYVFSGN